VFANKVVEVKVIVEGTTELFWSKEVAAVELLTYKDELFKAVVYTGETNLDEAERLVLELLITLEFVSVLVVLALIGYEATELLLDSATESEELLLLKLGVLIGTEELGVLTGTEELGVLTGTEELEVLTGTEELGVLTGTEELGVLTGTEELGVLTGTEELGVLTGTEELGVLVGFVELEVLVGVIV